MDTNAIAALVGVGTVGFMLMNTIAYMVVDAVLVAMDPMGEEGNRILFGMLVVAFLDAVALTTVLAHVAK